MKRHSTLAAAVHLSSLPVEARAVVVLHSLCAVLPFSQNVLQFFALCFTCFEAPACYSMSPLSSLWNLGSFGLSLAQVSHSFIFCLPLPSPSLHFFALIHHFARATLPFSFPLPSHPLAVSSLAAPQNGKPALLPPFPGLPHPSLFG